MMLSVITVNLNNKAGLEKTIRSVIAQTYKNFEFIIIDGGSTDGSLDVIKQFKDKITGYISEKDKGTYHAMNKGIDLAKCEYCYFLNSGDFLTENIVFENLFKQRIWADIVCGNVLKIRKGGGFRTIVPHENPSLLKLCIHSLPHQASIIRRSMFREIGYYNESFKIVSDFDFFLKALVINSYTYQRVDIAFSYFNLEGISSNPKYAALAKEESYICLKENFPQLADDLMDYRYFYTSNIGQTILLLKKKKRVYNFLEKALGSMISFKKMIAGK
jgi:glycosyltransferase involved in cell wall biosynthesis